LQTDIFILLIVIYVNQNPWHLLFCSEAADGCDSRRYPEVFWEVMPEPVASVFAWGGVVGAAPPSNCSSTGAAAACRHPHTKRGIYPDDKARDPEKKLLTKSLVRDRNIVSRYIFP
jgi:hypothetical protein